MEEEEEEKEKKKGVGSGKVKQSTGRSQKKGAFFASGWPFPQLSIGANGPVGVLGMVQQQPQRRGGGATVGKLKGPAADTVTRAGRVEGQMLVELHNAARTRTDNRQALGDG
ncbi:hypothetical protein S7711_10930 [Stachybotrys chartarum IBT 7711]|uniref:Uncharacterized protein n=1 Tax=Stachybotrys chartarum (strain CBS 109288 / IBT 7711) TaxID=1280523 RepID=A0A084ALD7_STACB|nr:hypothetical protein S7711_10930 [Stachybotrys chartarum IBT 7711]